MTVRIYKPMLLSCSKLQLQQNVPIQYFQLELHEIHKIKT